MESLCTRCARLCLQRGISNRSTNYRVVVRSFTTTTHCSEDSSNTSLSNQTPGPNVLRATRPPRTFNSPRPYVPRHQSANPGSNASRGQQGTGNGRVLQRTRPAQQGQQRRRPGDRRTSDPREKGNGGLPVKVRYADGSEAEIPVEQLLRPGRNFREPEAILGTRDEILNEMNGIEASDDTVQQDTTNAGGEVVEPTDAEINEYITKHVDRPANPTEPIPYHPSGQTAPELQKDWPDTPLSSTGLTATLIQKIELLARRIPHGYQTPEQIAEHFRKGNLTRFESDEEKQVVLKIAQQLAQKRADKLTERKGEQVTPADMTLSDLSKADADKKTLIDSMVRGDFGDAEKQRMPFLDSIMRNLRNNSTYHNPEMAKFMAKVESLIPAQAGNRRTAAKQAQRQP